MIERSPFTCDGCHEGDFSQFDHFCEVLNVTDAEVGHAFAAWLGGTTGWDGDYAKSGGEQPELVGHHRG